MPGLPPVSQESWKQARQDIDIMQSGSSSRRKKRHKLSIAVLCSCMVAQPPEDFPESSRPIEKKSPDSAGADASSIFEPAIVPQVAQKTKLDSTNEEEEPAQDIEMPPPMEIQEHSFKPESKEVSTDDVAAKLASQLTLKPQGDGTTSVELANQIENIVKNRIDQSSELASGQTVKTSDQELNQTDNQGCKEEEDKAGNDGKDTEAEKAKFLKKRQ